MDGCCRPPGYEQMFGPRYAARLARQYRRHGLDDTAERMVRWLADQGVQGASVLEIGGGVGAVQLELLRRGAARATSVELVGAYDEEARALADEAGVGDRVVRRTLDLVAAPELVEPHDVVVLHRVVCCYPDHRRLLTVAAAHARRVLVYSHPPRTLLTRAMLGAENLSFRLRRMPFRTYLHDPDAMVGVATRAGFDAHPVHRGVAWSIVGLARPPA